MSNFATLQFLYDNIPSEKFGLFIINLGNKGVVESTGGGNAEFYQEFLPRRYSAYDYGISTNSPLKFELIFGSLVPLDRQEVAVIQRWLIDRPKPCKLKIIQSDLENVYFNCRLTNPSITSVDNVPYAFKVDVVCNQGWALENPKTTTFVPNQASNNIVYYNNTDNMDYTKPTIEFTLSPTNNHVKIINNSDGGRYIELGSLSPNETITLDSDHQIITSSMGLYRLSNFTSSKHWFRLIRGKNSITIQGALSSFKITTQNFRKVGS